MAGRTVRVNIVGNSKSAVAAIDNVGVASRRAAKMSEQTLTASTTRVGGAFKRLDAQLGAFGVPFAGALGAIGTNLEGAEKKTKSLSGRLSTLGGAIALGAAAGIAVIGKSAIEAAIEGEQATARLSNAIANSGASYEDYKDRIDATSERLANFGYENDFVEDAIASLTRVTKDVSKSIDLMGLAADISRARNIDLAAATNILVAVEAGRYTILRRQLGLSAEQVKGIKSQEDALRLLSAMYGGAAARSAETFGGKIAALQAKSANLVEELGMKLLPVVEGTASGFLGAVQGIEKANSATDGWVGRVAVAATVLPVTVFAVEKLGAGLALLQAQYAKAGIGATTTSAAIAGSAVGTEAATVANAGLATSATTAALAQADQALAAGAVTVAQAALRAAQSAETVAVTALTAATADYNLAVSSAAVGSLRGAAADNVLAEAKTRLVAAQSAATAAAAGTAAAQEAATAATVGSATAAGSAATATGFLGTGLTGAGVAGLAATAGLLSFQGATWALNKIAKTTRPDVEGLTDSIKALAETGDVGGEMARAFGSDLAGLADDFRYLDRSGVSKAPGAFLSAGRAGRQAKADVEALDATMAGLVETVGPGRAQLALAQLTSQLAEQGVTVDDVVPRLHDYLKATEDAEATMTDSGRAADRLAVAQERLRLAERDGTTSAATLAERKNDVAVAARENARAQEAEAAATASVAEVSGASAKALDDLVAASGAVGPAARAIATSLNLSETEVKSLADKVRDLKSAFEGSFAKATALVGDFGDRTRVSFDEVRANYQKNIEATAAWAGNLKTLARAGLDQGLLEELAAAGPEAAAQVQAIVDGIGDGSIQTLNDLARFGGAARTELDNELSAAAVRAAIQGRIIGGNLRAGIPTSLPVDVPVSISGPLISAYLRSGGTYADLIRAGLVSGPLLPRADGGPVAARSAYVVGERGPELFIPKTSGTILPNSIPTTVNRSATNVSVPLIIELDGKQIANTVVRHSDRVGGLPIRIRTAS